MAVSMGGEKMDTVTGKISKKRAKSLSRHDFPQQPRLRTFTAVKNRGRSSAAPMLRAVAE
jgi:hypothetical protein